jgi:hypothetical protein
MIDGAGATGKDGLLCASMSIHAMPGAAGLAIFDPLQFFSWWVYGGVAVAYTALVFNGELSKAGPLIFSRRNARSRLEIVIVHLACLSILLALMRIALYIYPTLPNWMTDTFNGRGSAHSAFDILFIVVMIALHYIERRWLYVESETDSSGTEDKSSQASPANRGERL